MNSFVLTIGLGSLALIIELIFIFYCYQWLSAGKRQREKEFGRLDAERAELLELQSALHSDMKEAKALASSTVSKLQVLGAEAHAEWQDMVSKLDSMVAEIEGRSRKLVDDCSAQVGRQRLALESVCRNADERNHQLLDTLGKSERLLRFFDKSMPADQVVKELQTEKYAEARSMLNDGIEASHVARRLGISLSEVSLISHMK